MRITQALRGEHGAINPLLEFIDASLSAAASDDLRLEARMLAATLMTHAGIEDDVLLPSILEYIPPLATPTDHQRLGALLEQVGEATDVREARRLLHEAVTETRNHFAKEEEKIFPIAERELSIAEQRALGEEWSKRRAVNIRQGGVTTSLERLGHRL